MKGSILLVDDDELIREQMELVLKDEGYGVTSAIHGADAVQKLEGGFRPDIILLDMMMPIMGGEDFLLWKLRQKSPIAEIPTLLVTASKVTEAQRLIWNAIGVLAKPVDLDNLFSIIEEACRRTSNLEA
jgi:CheY-like chemotaxis protein